MSSKRGWDFLGLIHFGLFMIVLGLLFVIYPNLFDSLKEFFLDFEMVEISDNFFLPIVRGSHPEVYGSLLTLAIAMLLIEVLILVARFLIRDMVRRKADSISGIVFWVGISLLANQLKEGIVGFPAVYSLFAIVAGASIVSAGMSIILARTVEDRKGK
ncbi:MAG: hypothetical protein QFX35_05625 [Candidatus Verstraetearchaeota archaeon]|nr:hypothetical protein [Candidatus Verstraetearchaeota archaeon]